MGYVTCCVFDTALVYCICPFAGAKFAAESDFTLGRDARGIKTGLRWGSGPFTQPHRLQSHNYYSNNLAKWYIISFVRVLLWGLLTFLEQVSPWEPGVEYGPGSVVDFQGVQYRIIQPHRSQGDWTPDVTPALWGREWGIPPSQPQQNYGTDSEQRPWDQHGATKVEIPQEEKQKNWYDLDPERRKQLEIGGGLLAGAALLGGGFLAYKKHKENEEEKKALAWGLQSWMTDAQRRTQQFYAQGGAREPTWVLVHGTKIPQGAFQAGQESNGTPLYCARTYFEGGIHPGKVSPEFKKGAIIGYDNDEIEVENYEVLIADPGSVRWVDASGPCQAQFLGRPVEGGREANGSPLFIAQAPYKNGIHPGKTGEHLQGADITYGGDEKIVNPYRILVRA